MRLVGHEGPGFDHLPTAEDFIVPTCNMSDENPRGTARDANESQRQLVAELELLKLRTRAGKRMNRRGHDMRRTFITLARTDGAIDGLLRWVTHGPTSDMIDVYSSPPWSALCAEVSKLNISVREGTLLPMANTDASRWLKPTAEVPKDRALGEHRTKRTLREPLQVAALLAVNIATPTGFEPVLPA